MKGAATDADDLRSPNRANPRSGIGWQTRHNVLIGQRPLRARSGNAAFQAIPRFAAPKMKASLLPRFRRGSNPTCEQLVDLPAVHIHDLEAPAFVVEMLSSLGQVPEPGDR